MGKYIDKDALVAEIEKRKNFNSTLNAYSRLEEDYAILSFLDTLEVKEVDDEPECNVFPRPIECYSNCKECPWLATNNKAQKREKV